MVCACVAIHNFGVCMQTSEHMQYMRDTCLEFALGLSHYTSSVYVATIQ